MGSLATYVTDILPGGRTKLPCVPIHIRQRPEAARRKNGPHLCVTSIEGLKPDVGDDLRCGAVNGGGRMTIDHYPK